MSMSIRVDELYTQSCIVNYSSGTHYRAGQQRLIRALNRIGWRGGMMMWTDQLPPGSPPHPRSHIEWNQQGCHAYAFKAFAIKAAREHGYKIIMWLDASMVPVKPLLSLLEYVAEVGHWFPLDGWSVGQWCCDAALPLLELDREESFSIPVFAAMSFCMDYSQSGPQLFLREYLRLATSDAFRGPWTNKHGEASSDKRVLGHRHDLTCASVLVHRLGMKATAQPQWYMVGDSKQPEELPDEVYLVGDGNY